MIIQEVYFGQVPEIQEMFEEFKTLRNQYRFYRQGRNAKNTERFEKLVEKFFGFKAFSLSFTPMKLPNAYTYCVARSLDVDGSKVIETTSKGYRFRPEAHCAALSYITTGLIENKNVTDEEVFAIFLHEVGHSFVQRSPVMAAQYEVIKTAMIINIVEMIILGILTLNPIFIAMGLENAAYANNVVRIFRAEFQKAVRKVPLLREAGVTAEWALNMLCNVAGNIINTVFIGFTLPLLKYAEFQHDNVRAPQIKLTGNPAANVRSEERLADDFANMYGFGPHLATGLVKISDPNNQGRFQKVVYAMPVIKDIFGVTESIAYKLDAATGAHPGVSDRILSMVEGLEYDLAKDKSIPPKVKVELKANITTLKKEITKMKNNEGEIAKFGNEYTKALIILGLEEGSSEDFVEKKYTDRAELKKFYDERKVRAKVREQTYLDEDSLF